MFAYLNCHFHLLVVLDVDLDWKIIAQTAVTAQGVKERKRFLIQL